MEAVLSPRGQVTIPVSLRRKFGFRGGDKIVFAERDNDVVIRRDEEESSNMKALRKLQEAFAGEAERVGWTCEQDVVDYCKEIRREMWEERYANRG